jgi:hypothetical protein
MWPSTPLDVRLDVFPAGLKACGRALPQRSAGRARAREVRVAVGPTAGRRDDPGEGLGVRARAGCQNALREELQVAHDTLTSWLEALDRLCLWDRIAPHHRRVARNLTQSRKLYLWDWSVIEDAGARFENQVASHLLKAVHARTDLGHGEFARRDLRDKEGREVDFVITDRNRPLVLIECKLADESLAPALLRFGEALDLPQVQRVRTSGVGRVRGRTRVASADRYLGGLR